MRIYKNIRVYLKGNWDISGRDIEERKKMESKNIMIALVAILLLTLYSCKDASIDYSDGVYEEEDNYDERGWKARLKIEVADGKISSVDYEEVNEEGDIKSEDKEYGKIMEETSGVSPELAYERLETQFINKQDIKKVDIITGATSSSERFFKLVKKAIN